MDSPPDQRFVDEKAYSTDPKMDAMIRAELSSSRYTVASLKPAEVKRILRLYNVPDHKILECATNRQLVELAKATGIEDVPDQWTLDHLKQQQDEENAKISWERNNLNGRVPRPQ